MDEELESIKGMIIEADRLSTIKSALVYLCHHIDRELSDLESRIHDLEMADDLGDELED